MKQPLQSDVSNVSNVGNAVSSGAAAAQAKISTVAPVAPVEQPPVQTQEQVITPETLQAQIKDIVKEAFLQYAPQQVQGQQEPTKLALSPQPIATSKEELDAMLEDPSKLSKRVNELVFSYIEQAFTTLPSMINNTVVNAVSLVKETESFFANNPDLIPYEGILGQTLTELHARFPQMTINHLLQESGRTLRTKYNLLPRPSAAQTLPIPPIAPGGNGGATGNYAPPSATSPQQVGKRSLADEVARTFNIK